MNNEMINQTDAKRICQDARIAIDALESIAYCSYIHPDYLKEKIDTVKRCVEFMSHFCK